MKTEELKVKNPQDLDFRSLLFSVPEAFKRIKRFLERAKTCEIQKEEIVAAINDILSRSELFGMLLPFGWENLDLDSLNRVVSMAEILWRKPFYIV